MLVDNDRVLPPSLFWRHHFRCIMYWPCECTFSSSNSQKDFDLREMRDFNKQVMKQVGGVIHENADLAPTAHMLFSQVYMNIIHNKMSCDLEVTDKRSVVICKEKFVLSFQGVYCRYMLAYCRYRYILKVFIVNIV